MGDSEQLFNTSRQTRDHQKRAQLLSHSQRMDIRGLGQQTDELKKDMKFRHILEIKFLGNTINKEVATMKYEQQVSKMELLNNLRGMISASEKDIKLTDRTIKQESLRLKKKV